MQKWIIFLRNPSTNRYELGRRRRTQSAALVACKAACNAGGYNDCLPDSGETNVFYKGSHQQLSCFHGCLMRHDGVAQTVCTDTCEQYGHAGSGCSVEHCSNALKFELCTTCEDQRCDEETDTTTGQTFCKNKRDGCRLGCHSYEQPRCYATNSGNGQQCGPQRGEKACKNRGACCSKYNYCGDSHTHCASSRSALLKKFDAELMNLFVNYDRDETVWW